MKKTIFSGGLYLQSLKRLRTVGIAMMVCIVLLNLVMPVQSIMENNRYDHYVEIVDDNGETVYYKQNIDGFESVIDRLPDPTPVGELAFAPFLWAVGFFGPLMVWLLFSFLNERHKSDFYHSLPQTRVCVYLSMIAAVFTWLIGTVVVSLSLSAILWSFAKWVTFDAATVFANFAFFTILAVFMSGFMAVSMMLSGTVITNLLSYFFLLLFPPYVITLFVYAVDEAAPILISGWPEKVIYSFDRFLLLAFSDGALLGDVPVAIVSLAVGILMLVLAGVLYHFRRSESAGKSAPNQLLQHVYRIVFTSAAAVLLPFVMILDGVSSFLLFIVVAIVLVYVIYELMTTKKLGKMIRSLPFLVIPFVVAGIFFGAVHGIRAYVYSVRPEKEEILSVSFENMRSYNAVVYGVAQMSDVEFTGREVVDRVAEAFYDTLDQKGGYRNGNTYAVKIKLKNGKTIRRSVQFLSSDWQEICRMDGVKEYYLALPTWDALKTGKSIDVDPYGGDLNDELIWKTLLREYEALTEEQKYIFVTDASYHSHAYTVSAFVVMNDLTGNRYGLDSQVFSYTVFPDWMPETTKLITEGYGNEEKRLELIQGYASSVAQVQVAYFEPNGNKFLQTRVNTEKFYELVEIDSHLFAEAGENVMISFGSQSFWVKMTYEEKKALYQNTESGIVENHLSFRDDGKYTTWEE